MGTNKIINFGALGTVSLNAKTINTGALVANTPKTITHDFNLADYQLQVNDSNNNADVNTLKKDPADPTNKIIVETGVSLPGGLDVSIIGYN